ncbi:EAL domain-containing protein [Pseudoalteromonas sp. B193]
MVAEGVETKEQHTLLNKLDCDFMQGFYFSKPIPAKQFLDFSMNFDKK